MTPLPKPPREVAVNRQLDGLAPKFRSALLRVIDRMQRAGFDPMIFETHRTTERQRFLYGFGREYDDGRGIVTNSSTALNTWHGFGLAADIISRSKLWGASSEFWRHLGTYARAEGLVWGGDWPSFPDRPHVQWGAPMRRSPSVNAAVIKAKGGNEAVWKEVRAL
jgi:peptidoglycan LD-endopeptidase CwlK